MSFPFVLIIYFISVSKICKVTNSNIINVYPVNYSLLRWENFVNVIMSTIKVIFQKLPASELDFQQKLKSVTESKNELHDQFSEIQQLNIKQVNSILVITVNPRNNAIFCPRFSKKWRYFGVLPIIVRAAQKGLPVLIP